MYNRATLVGNVGKDPDVRDVGDTVVAKLSLATSEKFKNRDGERIEETTWHNVVFWRKLAEIVEKYVKKGDRILVEGKITTRSYEKDGEKKYITEIVADTMKMLGSPEGKSDKRDDDRGSRRGGRDDEERGSRRDSGRRSAPEPEDDFEDDIPF